MNSIEQAQSLIKRAMEIQEFTVSVKLPEDFRITGKVPFDINISGRVMDVTVYALTYDEANEQVRKWLEECK